MEKTKILIVDDEPDILEFMQYNLEREGFEVYSSSSGREAIKIATEQLPALIILDVMMHGMDGIETCQELRKNSSFSKTIIAFLTARSDDFTQIAGFESGGDDYISKPIKPKVLISRIKALLKRSGMQAAANITETNGLIIDRDTYSITRNGETLQLPKKEFELLAFLASKPGKIFSRDEILMRVWGNEVIVGDRTIDVHVRRLREKFGNHLIRTIKGVGYKFEG